MGISALVIQVPPGSLDQVIVVGPFQLNYSILFYSKLASCKDFLLRKDTKKQLLHSLPLGTVWKKLNGALDNSSWYRAAILVQIVSALGSVCTIFLSSPSAHEFLLWALCCHRLIFFQVFYHGQRYFLSPNGMLMSASTITDDNVINLFCTAFANNRELFTCNDPDFSPPSQHLWCWVLY